jgi:predicted rRNA pseudouridine synthase
MKEHCEKSKVISLEHVPLHANQLLESILIKNNIKRSHLKLGGNLERILNSKKPMTKHLLGRVIESLSKFVKEDEIEPLLPILHSDFYVERVKSIEDIRSEEEYVYDITVENVHNFIPECAIVISNCYDIGEVLGCGAHMQELRRTRAGPFVESRGIVTLHDVAFWFMEWQRQKDEKILRKFMLPMEEALALIPKIYIRDSAVDAICHGANLTAPGVLSLETGIDSGLMVAVFTLKGEAVALAKAVASSEEILNMEHGVVTKTERVLMPRGTYLKCWKSSEK